MEYLLKVSGLIVVFYLIYIFLLQKETFFKLNRSFLLLGLGISFVLPLCVIPVYHEYTSQILPLEDLGNFEEITSLPITNTEKPLNIWEYLPFVYGAGVLCFLGLFLFKLITLIKVMSITKNYKKEDYTFIETDKDISPFSFFKWIVYNPNQFNQTELTQIIAHEKVHAKQYHSIDILLMELCGVFLWFHPIVWLYNKSVKQNLEFLADTSAANQFKNRKSYQYTLLKVSVPNHQIALSNHFYNSLIKKRIVMLQKSKSKKINLLKYVLVLPVLALFLMGFNREDIYDEKGTPPNEARMIIDKNTSDDEFNKFIKTFKEDYNIGVVYKGIKRNYENELSSITVELFLPDSLKYSKTQKSINNDLISIEPFVISYNFIDKVFYVGDLKDEKKNENKIFINKSTSDKRLKEHKDLFQEKYNIDFSYNKIKRNDKGELTSINVDLKSKTGKLNSHQNNDEGIESFIIEYNSDTKEMSTSIIRSFGETGKNISIRDFDNVQNEEKLIYIIDGKHASYTEYKKLNKENIQSVNVLKDKATTHKYGKKGRDGVIEITMKKDEVKVSADKNTKQKRIEAQKLKREEAIVKRAKAKHAREEQKLKREEKREKIALLKTKREEQRLKNKVSKSYPGIKVSSYENDEKTESLGINQHEINVDPNDLKSVKNLLYILNGKEISDKEYKQLNLDNIYSKTILKGKSATDKYGEKGKNGVVEVVMKK